VTLLGDFNDDGKSDLASNGANIRFQLLNGVASLGVSFVGAGGNTLRYGGDLSGEGSTDIGLQSGNNIRLNLIAAGASTGQAFLGAGGGTLFP